MLVINLKTDQVPTHQQLVEELVSINYCRVSMVLEPGDFAVRGAIIDVFPLNETFPIRIECFGDDIERLTSFNVHNQRSISTIEEISIHSFDTDKQKISVSGEIVNDELIASLSEGDYVVHENFGIGCFQGLKRMSAGGISGEYAYIRYQGEDKLFVPLDQMNLLHRYAGSELASKINSLTDGKWKRTRAKVEKATEALAQDIYELYKVRLTQDGFAFEEVTAIQAELENDFEHTLTLDQQKATGEVKKDMEAHKPMDRLIVGDVGYGKTEVILRAVFKALENNKQACILVPTTVLAEQHYRTFKTRFEKYLYSVEVLSRFRTKKEQIQIISELKKGLVQVVIGTHRLLQSDVKFQDLGLLVVDEEQRFGVAHKEKIKKIKTDVDVLSVSATPIPRTMYMALTGARDLSKIETPPVDRKPVLTTVTAYDEELCKEVVLRELRRKGQVFYVYNNVRLMGKKFASLRRLFPSARISMGHGQMKETVLHKVMLDFVDHEIDILLCSTIIENGLDVPNANTVVIDEVQNYGLSQIHQIRGRVGRSIRQGYAVLLYTSDELLSEKARKRLLAVKEYAVLGAGYKLALKDLEIRGSGSLLGKKQHGHMITVGFDLYCKLLEKSVQQIRQVATSALPAISLPSRVDCYIPDDYVLDERERLAIYQRLMACTQASDVDNIAEEMADRFGQIPEDVITLLAEIRNQRS